ILTFPGKLTAGWLNRDLCHLRGGGGSGYVVEANDYKPGSYPHKNQWGTIMRYTNGYRHVTLENVTWVDFRPCYRCVKPSGACQTCRYCPADRVRQDQTVDSRQSSQARERDAEM